jgi:hypothetical protein
MSQNVSLPMSHQAPFGVDRDPMPYDAPTVTLVGNVRDLLAGATGSAPDAEPPPDSQPGG